MRHYFHRYIKHVETQTPEIKSVHAFFWAFILTFIFTFWYLLLVRNFFDTSDVKNILNSEQTFQSDAKYTQQISLEEQKNKYKEDVTKASESIRFNFQSLFKIKDNFKNIFDGE